MTYRVLSLDGGGSWALIEVQALIALYSANTSGYDVLKDFDLVAANSGGSIVLGGLLENLTLADILALFQDQRQREAIFSPTKSFGDRVLHDLTGLGPKYSAAGKLVALQRALPTRGNVVLTGVTAGLRRAGSAEDLHVLITSFDYDRNRARFFRSSTVGTPAVPKWGQGAAATITLAEAIHASTNAPVNYFDAAATFPDGPGRYWDGAITGANNPVLAGVAEAIALGQKPTDVVALSIGTGSVALPWPAAGQGTSPFVQKPSEIGLVNDLRKLAGSILDDPPDIATYLAHVMTGGPWDLKVDPTNGRIVRMNPLVSPVQGAAGGWVAPGRMTTAQFSYLMNLGMDAVEQHEVDAIADYARLWLGSQAPNQPVRMDADTLTVEIGNQWVKDAIQWWNKIR